MVKTTASSPADRKVHGESGSRASCKINTRASVPFAPTAPSDPFPLPKRRRGSAELRARTLLVPSEVMGTREELWIRLLPSCGTMWQRFCPHRSQSCRRVSRGPQMFWGVPWVSQGVFSVSEGCPVSQGVPKCSGAPPGVSKVSGCLGESLGVSGVPRYFRGILGVLGGPQVFWSIPGFFTGQRVSWRVPGYFGGPRVSQRVPQMSRGSMGVLGGISGCLRGSPGVPRVKGSLGAVPGYLRGLRVFRGGPGCLRGSPTAPNSACRWGVTLCEAPLCCATRLVFLQHWVAESSATRTCPSRAHMASVESPLLGRNLAWGRQRGERGGKTFSTGFWGKPASFGG